jgi:hypothetical protein
MQLKLKSGNLVESDAIKCIHIKVFISISKDNDEIKEENISWMTLGVETFFDT